MKEHPRTSTQAVPQGGGITLEPLIRLLRRWGESLEQLAFTAFNIFLALFVALIVLVAAAALGVGVLKELSGQELSADLGAPHFEAQIALMLLIVACLDLGLTAFLGTFVLTEFIRSRGRPRLALGFVDPWTGMGYSRLPLRIAAGDQQSVAFDVAIRNEGNTSAVWYMFELETPFRARYLAKHLGTPERVQPNGQGTVDLLHQTLQTELDHGRWRHRWLPERNLSMVRFESHGEVAVYPHAEAVLGTFTLPVEAFRHNDRFVCKYTIHTDRSRPFRGRLHIAVDVDGPGMGLDQPAATVPQVEQVAGAVGADGGGVRALPHQELPAEWEAGGAARWSAGRQGEAAASGPATHPPRRVP